MNANRKSKWWLLSATLAIGIAIGFTPSVVAQQVTAIGQDGIEALTRGPVHEAFAETISFDPEPGMLISTAPPQPVEEMAPDQRPQGTNVSWIPGYWGWDDERNDFLWISGIWRSLPPGRQWVPGYWGESQQGYQWTSGYWADATAREIEYLPEPPASVEAGPNVAATSTDDIWIPGSWIWQQNRYAWRPGQWAPGNRDWDWVPDHYVWTPRGYVFVDGYYDYSVSRRGVVFAPVYLTQGLRSQSGFSYSPSTVINPGVFLNHLFVRPRYGHYYFGDYYGTNYADAGYSPWFSYQSSRRGYDPIYASQRWQNRQDRGWEQRAEANYRNLSDNESGRPPRNWAAQRERASRGDNSNQRNFDVAAPFSEWSQRNNGQMRFQPVDPAERQQYGQRTQDYRRYLRQRQQLEANAAAAQGVNPTTTITTGPQRGTISRSPFAAAAGDQLGQDYTPPTRHQVLKPDFQVQPQPRTRRGESGARQGLQPGTPYGQAGQNQAGQNQQRRNQDRQNQAGQNQPWQNQPGAQGRQQRQGVNQGNSQAPDAGQQQSQRGNRNRQGEQNRPQQGGSQSSQQAATGAAQQAPTGGTEPAATTPPAVQPTE